MLKWKNPLVSLALMAAAAVMVFAISIAQADLPTDLPEASYKPGFGPGTPFIYKDTATFEAGPDTVVFSWTRGGNSTCSGEFYVRVYPLTNGTIILSYTGVDWECDIAENAVWTALGGTLTISDYTTESYQALPATGSMTVPLGPGMAIKHTGTATATVQLAWRQ